MTNRNDESRLIAIGVDGGQSSTRCLVVDETGTILGHGCGGPSNHAYGGTGRRRLHDALESSIRGALPGIPPVPVESIALGMTGIGKDLGRQDLVKKYVQELVTSSRITICNDLVIALMGASVGRPAIIVYAGTGTHTYGFNEEGNEVRVGGWGHIIDDEGGGYDTGREALKRTFRSEDGREPPTILKSKLLTHFGCTTLAELRNKVYEGAGLGRPEIARLARLVAEVANEGDQIAQAILARAGRILGETAIVALQKLGKSKESFDVYYGGGVFVAGEHVLHSFRETLAAAAPKVKVRAPAFPPVVGAVFLAFQRAKIPVNEEMLDHLAEGVKQIGWGA